MEEQANRISLQAIQKEEEGEGTETGDMGTQHVPAIFQSY